MRLKDVGWSFLGLLFPAIAAFATIPTTLSNVGAERFGLLSLAWAMVGFAGLLDLGLGRALTQIVSRLNGLEDSVAVVSTARSALRIAMPLGITGCTLILLLTILELHELIKYDPRLSEEVRLSMVLMAFTVPLQSLAMLYRGLCEAFGLFREVGIVRMVAGAATFLAPCAVSLFFENLQWLVLSLLISRLAALVAYRHFANLSLLRLRVPKLEQKPSKGRIVELIRFGGWYSVGSLLAPIYFSADRFFIGAIVAAAAVSIYTVPFEIITQILMVVGAVTTVTFPVVSRLTAVDVSLAHAEFKVWTRRVIAFVAPLCVLAIIAMPAFLSFWLGELYDERSALVAQILSIGVFANAVGLMYYNYVQAYGRVDLTTRLQLFELPFYIMSMYFLIEALGVIGAAIAWTGRVIVDAVLLIVIKKRVIHI
jgi:O-antigen/teichoic acid export membrane protein